MDKTPQHTLNNIAYVVCWFESRVEDVIYIHQATL